MKIRLLGTGTSQGIPIIGCHCPVCTSNDVRDHRLRTSALVNVDGLNILIDTGPDLRYQLLRSGTTRLDAVLFTHEHKDHTAGLDDVRPINFLMKQPLNLYGLPRVMRAIERDFSYAFAEEHYPGAPILNTNDIEPEPFKIGKVEIIPIKLMHSSQRMAKQLPILGYRIKNFAYITDARGISWNEIPDIATVPFSPSEKAKLKGLDTLVINALRREEHYSHLSLPQTLSIIEQIQPRRAYLTHISHHLGLYEEVMKELPQNVFLGIDNQLIDIDDD